MEKIKEVFLKYASKLAEILSHREKLSSFIKSAKIYKYSVGLQAPSMLELTDVSVIEGENKKGNRKLPKLQIEKQEVTLPKLKYTPDFGVRSPEIQMLKMVNTFKDKENYIDLEMHTLVNKQDEELYGTSLTKYVIIIKNKYNKILETETFYKNQL